MVAPSVLHLFANIGRDNMARPVIQYGAPILVSAAPRGKLELMTALADHVISLLTWVASTLISALVMTAPGRTEVLDPSLSASALTELYQ